MKILGLIVLFFIGIACCSCEDDSSSSFQNIKSDEAKLLSMSVEYASSTFELIISGKEIRTSRPLPFGANELIVKSVIASKGALVDKKIGDVLNLKESISLSVTSEDESISQIYSFDFNVKNYSSIVNRHGLLAVDGNKIVDKNGKPLSLAGNSFFWSNDNWGGMRFYKASVVSWLKLDWSTSLVRAAMGIQETGGYLDNKSSNINRVKVIVDAAIEQGIYVIIDWHSHHAEDNVDEAVAFFTSMAQLYGEYDNIIYEIYNEPLDVSWDDTIKPYAERVIAAIRSIDSDNLILVGTPEWSQRVDLAAANPINHYSNIAYVLHFYTVHHQEWLRKRADEALNKGIAIFITEWGPLGYTQDDPEADKWMEWCKENDISHCSWAVNDKVEEWSILKPSASTSGLWQDYNLTESGKLCRSIIRNW